MQEQLSDEEEKELSEYYKRNEDAKIAYITSPKYRSDYVDRLEKIIMKMSYLERWAIRVENNPQEVNIEELKFLLLDIKKTRGF